MKRISRRIPSKAGRRSTGGVTSALEAAADKAGRRDALLSFPHGSDDPSYLQLNRQWTAWVHGRGSGRFRSFPAMVKAAKRYSSAYCRTARLPHRDFVPVPTTKSVAAIVTAMNEEGAIGAVLKELNRLPLDETIVVVNGSQDRTFSVARAEKHATIIHYPQPLGHDVGRAIGASAAQADILLFVDGDFPIAAERLAAFIYAVECGSDVALNDISPFLQHFASQDEVTIVKQFLNRSLGRPDLHANSLTAVPHALSRKAVETIGAKQLIVPPKAQALAIMLGLSVTACASVDVISKNRKRKINVGEFNAVAGLIVGDHLEAMRSAMMLGGSRLHWGDSVRKREWARGSLR